MSTDIIITETDGTTTLAQIRISNRHYVQVIHDHPKGGCRAKIIRKFSPKTGRELQSNSMNPATIQLP